MSLPSFAGSTALAWASTSCFAPRSKARIASTARPSFHHNRTTLPITSKRPISAPTMLWPMRWPQPVVVTSVTLSLEYWSLMRRCSPGAGAGRHDNIRNRRDVAGLHVARPVLHRRDEQDDHSARGQPNLLALHPRGRGRRGDHHHPKRRAGRSDRARAPEARLHSGAGGGARPRPRTHEEGLASRRRAVQSRRTL